jgi:phosphoribosylaminoimidazolecarboxamide formyltransferase/IMP cyclohydrolase
MTAYLCTHIKHTHGLASRATISEAYVAALCDPTSALVVFNCKYKIDVATANEINKLFCEVVIAPEYDEEAIAIFKKRKTELFNSKRS